VTALSAFRDHRAPLRLVIFDCDGVLVDSEPVSNRILAEDLSARGWPMPTEEATRRFLGLSLPTMRAPVEAHLGRPLPPDWEATLQARIADALAIEAIPVPGALAALAATEMLGLPWRIASNSSHAEMTAKFHRLGMTERVKGRLHSFTDVARGKPAPDLFLAAAAAQQVPPAECLVVEDSVTGVRGAVAAGMACLGYAPHGDGAFLRAEGATPFHSMTELPALLVAALRRAA